MSWQTFFVAISLVFVIEGILPFLSPRTWRRSIYQMSSQSDTVLRVMGLMSMLLGLVLLSIVRYWSE